VKQLVTLLALSLASWQTTWADLITAAQREVTAPTGTLVPTDWGPVPLTFGQFDPRLGELRAVILSFAADIRVDYRMNFVTPSTIVLTTNDPRRGNLAGPQVTLTGPLGLPLFVATQTPDRREVTADSGVYSSLLGTIDPHYLPPTITHELLTRTITEPSLLIAFTGDGTVDLFAGATAYSSFSTSSGNGGGSVVTGARADVMLAYRYTPAVVEVPPHAVPEPPSGRAAALGIAIVAGVAAGVTRYRVGRAS
jgi:hypothetical protein